MNSILFQGFTVLAKKKGGGVVNFTRFCLGKKIRLSKIEKCFRPC